MLELTLLFPSIVVFSLGSLIKLKCSETPSKVADIQVEETAEGIDYSQLKQQEKIHFYDDVILYEDELADNGTAMLNVKIVSCG